MKNFFKNNFPITIKDFVIFIVVMSGGAFICALLRRTTSSDVHVPLIFVLVVLIVSLLTDGYFYGLLAAVTSVFAVNWAFTYPYLKLDFSIYGYPLTFITMLAVGIATSALVSQIKASEKIRLEIEKEKMRANLLRSVSHDLRTPLTSIGGNISAVIDSGDSMSEEDKTKLLQNARDNTEWLYKMVENLLSVTKINSVDDELSKADELLEEVLGEAISRFKSRFPETEVLITVPDEAVFVPMDAMLIEQVLINLMDNAVTHGKNTTEITITALNCNKYISVSVADNGGGIDMKILPKIFSGDAGMLSGSDNNRFSGIGLMVCKTIIEAHGGVINVCNKGNGAVFTFTLPTGGNSNNAD